MCVCVCVCVRRPSLRTGHERDGAAVLVQRGFARNGRSRAAAVRDRARCHCKVADARCSHIPVRTCECVTAVRTAMRREAFPKREEPMMAARSPAPTTAVAAASASSRSVRAAVAAAAATPRARALFSALLLADAEREDRCARLCVVAHLGLGLLLPSVPRVMIRSRLIVCAASIVLLNVLTYLRDCKLSRSTRVRAAPVQGRARGGGGPGATAALAQRGARRRAGPAVALGPGGAAG